MTMALARDSASARSLGFAASGALDVERSGALLHEDAGADEDGLCAELHHEGGVGRCGDAAGGEVGNGQLAGLGDHADQLVGSLMVLGGDVELLVVEYGERVHLAARSGACA